MSTFIRALRSKWLLILWGIFLLVISLRLPSILTHSYIYMGMLVGYLAVKIPLFGIVFNFPAEMAYSDLIYEYLSFFSQHIGLTILTINTVYWITLAVLVHHLLQRIGKLTLWKTVLASVLLAGTMIYLVGSAVIYLYFTNIL
jgi:hypothetical protein